MKSDAGVGVATFLLAMGSLIVGGAAAAGAVGAVISKYGPGDGGAMQNGPRDLVPPNQILNYGG